ncbi:MAG: molybdate ABC transporter substrate-binding protein [Thermoanaerobaculum sp.]|nr:molybdate ABC transporter substrate-binding protein [Thermoanaerobaculum sp.]MDW7968576.1 molybdate ABC transporter substrate-binding protein [Thermoanaerobaculum sp.]
MRWLPGLLLWASATSASPPVELLVFAGAASKPVLDEAAAQVQLKLPIRLLFSYGGSGAVLTQLELARRGDLYIPGSHDWLDRAAARGVVDPATRVDFAYLRPALLVRAQNPKGIGGLADLARADVRAAIADPRTVCVGEYGERLLQRAGLWAALMPRLARAHSCEAVANLLATGTVDAVLGWDVFVAWFPGEVQEVPLPAAWSPGQATVAGAVTVFSRHPQLAQAFLRWLAGPQGKALWRRHGYQTPP